MRDLRAIERELISIGSYIRFFGRPEVRELPKILVDNEQIKHCITGKYEAGYALLCVTDLRILLIDKKPFFLTLEDIRYDMVMDVDYSYQFVGGQVTIIMPNKQLKFASFKNDELRNLSQYVQKRVLEYRQQHVSQHRVVNTEPEMTDGSPVLVSNAQPAAANQDYASFSIPKAIHPYVQTTLTVRRQTSR